MTVNERELFIAALQIDDHEQRVAYVKQACGDDVVLFQRLLTLLQAYLEAGSYLDQPAVELQPTIAHHRQELPGGQIGPYRLLEPIGEGGMGTVWLAEQTHPIRRRVAIKLIKAGMDSRQVLARFEAERQALSLMDHPNIAKVLEAGTIGQAAWPRPSAHDHRRPELHSPLPQAADQPNPVDSTTAFDAAEPPGSDRRESPTHGQPYFVMEWVKGLPITQYCDEHRLDTRQRLSLFMSVCHAIQHAHQKGIIHRDIKPSNVLVTEYDGAPVAKVIDFGVAKALHQPLTQRTMFTGLGQIIGTLEYMSPEQARINQLDIDTRSDVYSLGVLLYELLTGSTPFDRKRLHQAALDQILRIIREEEPPKPSTKVGSSETLPSIAAKRSTEPTRLTRLLQGELDWILMKSLAKERERRYESASSFADDIRRFLDSEPVLAGPPSNWYRLTKLVRRHRLAFLATGTVMVAILLGAIGTGLGFLQATRSAATARSAQAAAELGQKEAEHQKLLAQQATAKERQAAELTAKRLQQIEVVNNAMFEIFQDIDVQELREGNQKLETLLGERLVAVGHRLDPEAISDPRVLASLYNRLGQTLLSLGRPTEATQFLIMARTLCDANLEETDPVRLTVMSQLAVGYRGTGQLDLAMPLFLETLSLMETQLGPEAPETLTLLGNLAEAWIDLRKLDQAIPLLERILPSRQRLFGLNDPLTLRAMGKLATAYEIGRQFEKALPLLEETLDKMREHLGPDHPNTLTCLGNLGNCLRSMGRLEQALPYQEEAWERKKATLGARHLSTLLSMNNLATTYWQLKQLDKSVPLFEGVLAGQEAILGRDHPDTLATVGNLGVNLRDAGRVAEGLPLLQEAYRAAPQHPRLRWIGFPLLETYQRQGQIEVAAEMVAELLPEARRQLPAASLPLSAQLTKFGQLLLEAQRPAEAAPLLEECWQIREQHQPGAWSSHFVRALLGTALLRQQKLSEAESHLVAGYEGLLATQTGVPPTAAARTAEVLERVLELYDALGNPPQAAKYRQPR